MDMAFDDAAGAPDAALLVLYANGDRGAARTLTLRLTPLALRVASRMLGDTAEAEDVAQEAMLRLWRVANDWRQGEAKVSTWLYRVTVNLCTDRLRRRRTVPIDSIPEPEEHRPGVLAGMIAADRAAAFQAAMDTLPERQRQAVVLRHLEGLTNPEIADVMDIGVEAVESLTARGKRALAAALSGQRAELGYEDEQD
jgi:RNA polymerase sigma factor (sigma-70 family)